MKPESSDGMKRLESGTLRGPDRTLCVGVMVALTLGLFATWQGALGNEFRIAFAPLQIVFVSYVGWVYRKDVALWVGALVFLPNALLCLVPSSALPNTRLDGSFFLSLPSDSGCFGSYALGWGYLYYASLGFCIGGLRERWRQQTHLGIRDEPTKFVWPGGYWNLIALPPLVLAVSIRSVFGLEYTSLNGSGLAIGLASYLIYLFGARAMVGLVATLTLASMYEFGVGRSLSFGALLNASELPLWMLALVFYNQLAVDDERSDGRWRAIGYWFRTLALCVIGHWMYYYSRDVILYGAAFALPGLLWMGRRYGSEAGLLAGVIWCAVGGVFYALTSRLRFGLGFNEFLIVAPWFGYVGGLRAFSVRPVRVATLSLSAFCGYLVVARWSALGSDFDWAALLVFYLSSLAVFHVIELRDEWRSPRKWIRRWRARHRNTSTAS